MPAYGLSSHSRHPGVSGPLRRHQPKGQRLPAFMLVHGGRSPELLAQSAQVVCCSQRLPNNQSGCRVMFPDKIKAAPVAAPTANKIKTVLTVALAAAANHGLDLLSGCCSLGLR